MPRIFSMTTTRAAILVLLLGLVFPLPVPAGVSAKISKVTIQSELDGASDRTTRLAGRRLTKFQGTTLVRGSERIHVLWSPPPTGLKAGTTLLFEYRRQFGDKVSALANKLAFGISTPQETIFDIPLGDAGEDGPISMWRVRLVDQGKTLTEKTSPTWR